MRERRITREARGKIAQRLIGLFDPVGDTRGSRRVAAHAHCIAKHIIDADVTELHAAKIAIGWRSIAQTLPRGFDLGLRHEMCLRGSCGALGCGGRKRRQEGRTRDRGGEKSFHRCVNADLRRKVTALAQ